VDVVVDVLRRAVAVAWRVVLAALRVGRAAPVLRVALGLRAAVARPVVFVFGVLLLFVAICSITPLP
jgi:hypothetical protein